jgi:hypothetical protein
MAVLGVQQEAEPNEAAVVRRIFEMYANGNGFAAIAKQLNHQGIPSPRPANRHRHFGCWEKESMESVPAP